MSIKIELEMERTLTERVWGSFTTNHTEDEVRKWIDTGGLECNTHSLDCYTTTDETMWEPTSLQIEPYVESEVSNDFKFDGEIQEWRMHKIQ